MKLYAAVPVNLILHVVLFLPVVFGPSRSTLKAHKVGLGVKLAPPARG
eukprot:SAG11_NODE_2007_length_3928_cov_2.013581_1_plen_47_part_10